MVTPATTREDILRAADIYLDGGRARQRPTWGLNTIASFHTHGAPPITPQ
ncbi:hypothetical protein GCM10020216_107160 [Nonomuraea helvata]